MIKFGSFLFNYFLLSILTSDITENIRIIPRTMDSDNMVGISTPNAVTRNLDPK